MLHTLLRRGLRRGLPAVLLLLATPLAAWAAEEGPAIDTGDTTWVLVSAALVMLMTPGLALFYGGMVSRKNVLNTVMLSFIALCVISVQWVLWGYSLAFGPDVGHIIGSLDWLGLQGVGQAPSDTYATTVPHQAFMAFQMMFAILTPALITGALAERMRFSAFLLFLVLWATFVYDPLCHWVWAADGWLCNLGALDFAGGTVVHIASGVAGLVTALVLGKRKGYGKRPMPPHNLPLTVLGAALLWFGWFGFNAGSAVAANGLAASAFVVTNTAAAAAALGWVVTEWLRQGKPTVLGAASGCVAGLVAITPAAGFVSVVPAVIIGLAAGVLCYLAVSVLKRALGYDDALDAFGIHGIGGTLGALATGVFAVKAVNELGSGLLDGNPGQLVTQLIAVVASWAFVALATFVILKIVGLIVPLRVSEEDEETGLDVTQHGESGYSDDFALGSALAAGAVKASAAVTSGASVPQKA
ncbi:MAG: ammonium transporter [Thermoanaerobacterales bacterium]|nr:ammonium transporter [Bacillota bacterium]MDI6906026.1 ammonium transporter [Thermoanaerobacterales bacterium]